MGSGFDAAMVLLERGMDGKLGCGGFIEIALAVGGQRQLVVFDGEQIVGLGRDDRIGDPRIAADGIDADQCAFHVDAPDELGDRDDFIGFHVDGLLAEDEMAAAGESRDEMQRRLVVAS